MMYYEFWGLKKPPFDNVPDPSMYVDCHASVENAIAETLFAIEEGNECIAVVFGDVGLGKTLSLRMIIDSLDQEKYRIAFVTNPDMSFVQLLREIIGQITGQQCESKTKVDLLEIFNKLIFQALDEGKKVLIFIDEANAMSPANLESLRLLTNMQEDERNLFTIVLAGQIELARRLEHPKRANLFQRVGTYNRLDKIESEELVRTYVETRLKLAGGDRRVFTDDAISMVWEYSQHGIPRLINKICKLSLKAGETNNLQDIPGELVRQIGERFQKLTGPSVEKRKPRARPVREAPEEEMEDMEMPVQPPVIAERVVVTPVIPPEGVFKEEKVPEAPVPPPVLEEKVLAAPVVPPEKVLKKEEPVQEEVPSPVAAEPELPQEADFAAQVSGFEITIHIPGQILAEANTYTDAYCGKLAGTLAAETLAKHPQLTASYGTDPVRIWNELRDLILNALRKQKQVV
jgi:type II secretory pathway predicted ATPase ExeA